MPWIKTIEPAVAEGELRKLYDAIGSSRGGVAEVHRVQSLNPRALRAHLELYKAVVFASSSLSRVARERIAVTVSAANQCAYCVAHHGEALRQLGDDVLLVEALGRGELGDTLSPSDRVLLQWAQIAAREPAGSTQAGVIVLQNAGFDDRAILDAALTVAYFSFVNRLVLMLGVAVEKELPRRAGPTSTPARNVAGSCVEWSLLDA